MNGPKLFTHSSTFFENAYVGPGGLVSNDSAHAHAWKEAADTIADHALARSRGQLDFFFPVICYLYRHYVELELKLVIRLAAHFAGKAIPDLTREHSIEALLSRLNVLLASFPDLQGAFDGEIGAMLHELHTLDPTVSASATSRVAMAPLRCLVSR